MKRIPLLLAFAVVACSSSAGKPAAPPPASATSPAAVPGRPALSRTNPNIIEETETSYIERLPKSGYIKVDDRHVKDLLMPKPIEFFKEDENYYYISVAKILPEEAEAKRQETSQRSRNQPRDSTPPSRKTESAVPLSDFEDLTLPRVSGRIRLQEATGSGLPDNGMWRASFAVTDVNGDGIPDIVAPTSRLGDGKLHVWIGDGRGHFSAWPLTFGENDKPSDRFFIDYGGVAVGDIDGDGKMDIVCASHGGGLVSLFGDGKAGFTVLRTGLPKRDFSSQAVTLLDADGDGRLDIVASRDIVEQEPNQPLDKSQVRVYLFRGREKGWEFQREGIVGGFYSNCLNAWDFDRDGRQDVLTGSHQNGALVLLWKSRADATFSPVMFPAIEVYSYHFATAPGTFGKDRAAAFADSFLMQTNVPQTAKAAGISLYSLQGDTWTRHRLWRKKDPKSSVYGLAMGDLDGDGLDDVAFADSDRRRVRILFQQPDGLFVELEEKEEPTLDSPGQCVRLADLDGDGRLDIVVSRTVVSSAPKEKGGWNVYLNRTK